MCFRHELGALEWPQYGVLIFQSLEGSGLRSQRSDLAEIKLIRDVIVVLVTCKNEEDPIKNEVARVATTFSPL